MTTFYSPYPYSGLVIRALTTGAEGPGFKIQLVRGIFQKLSPFTQQ